MLLLVYLSVYISPEKTIVVALLPFIYVILFLVNVFFVLFWLIFNLKYSLISFITILTGIKFISLIFPIFSLFSTNNENPDVKIMSYNVMIFGFYDWDNNKQIKSEIFRIIDNENAEILCLQEAYWNTSNQNFVTLSKVKQMLDADFCYKSAMATAVGGQNFGLVTISKFPIVNSFSHKFDSSFNGFIYNDILINSDTIRVFNVHLQSIQLNQNDYTMIEDFVESEDNRKMKIILKKYLSSLVKRADQAEFVKASIDSCKYPVFVCGDFNDGPLTYTYFTIAKGLKDSYATNGKYPGTTWNKFNLQQRIDFVLYDKRFDCVMHKVIEENYSDHFPIIAGFRLKDD